MVLFPYLSLTRHPPIDPRTRGHKGRREGQVNRLSLGDGGEPPRPPGWPTGGNLQAHSPGDRLQGLAEIRLAILRHVFV